MKKNFLRLLFILCLGINQVYTVSAQNPKASLRVDKSVVYQKVTGFGGFVNSPQFQYGHMTTAEIQKLWGANSEMGYNIMRLYLPIASTTASPSSPDAWSQSLATAKLAKQLGVKVFASPWSMPAEWKTYNTVNAVFTDANGVKQMNYLKEEYYDDYATYLNNYVTYLRNNGVELDAISIQNEPDWGASYAGCIWTPTQIAGFVRDYGSVITCPIIAAEGIGTTNNYAEAFLPDAVFNKFGIFAGHQYAGIQTTGIQQLQAKGKEVWMTEFLINWNENQTTTRNFNWSIDAFSFFNAVNTAMESNINAWIHYAAKRYYGMMGDGQFGTTTGVITKRGYILSHFSKYVTGATRIGNEWRDESGVLKGSTYLSADGNDVTVMMINSSNNPYDLTVDLPFYTMGGNHITTSQSKNMTNVALTYAQETCRPKITVDASSITTLVFHKNSERPASLMSGKEVHYNTIENQSVTNPAFGTTYQLSGKTAIFDNSHKLISANTTDANGYVSLNDQYNQLVFHIETISSPASYTSANTTLYYINDAGVAKSYNYGTVTFNQSGNTDWVLDISRNKLTDGCAGILGISNGNYSSILTIKFGDVYFRMGNEQAFEFTGTYSNGDSNLLDCLDNAAFTSLDFKNVLGITSDLDWSASAVNKNCIYYVGNDVTNTNANVVAGTTCDKLTLFDTGGNFNVPYNFSTTNASYIRTIEGYGILVLPFDAAIPAEVQAYTLQATATEVTGTEILNNQIPANTPVLVKGRGTFTFVGSGNVTTPHRLIVNDWRGVYIAEKAPATTYQLNINGAVSFNRVASGAEPTIMPFNAYLIPGFAVSELSLPLIIDGVQVTKIEQNVRNVNDLDNTIYDLMGRRVDNPQKGVVYIKGGKKYIIH
jgi:glucuronoarabinoxylan endo-1,4-beta-xylanase